MIHLGIVEDESIMRSSLTDTFVGMPDVAVVLTAPTVESFMEDLTDDIPLNTLLLDINLPGLSGLQGIKKFKERRPDLDIIMLTNLDDSDNIFKALCEGAISYISKKKANPQILREAVYTVHRGGSYMSPGIARKVVEHFAPRRASTPSVLTQRQHEIVEQLTLGKSYKMIADELDISVETVRDHIKNIYKLLQVHSKAEVIGKKLRGEI